MQIENHKEEVPFAHYEEKFRALEPASVLERLKDVAWDGTAFAVTLLGREFAISHPEYAIRAVDEGPIPPLATQTFLLRYLLESKKVTWCGTWKTFREMPWGEMYIKPYTGRVLTRAAYSFSFKLAKFAEACEGYYQFTLTTLMDDTIERGGISPTEIFGLSAETMERLINGLSINHSEFITCSFKMDLDSITLRPDKTSDDVLALFEA